MACAANQTSIKSHCRNRRPRAARVAKPRRLTKKQLRQINQGFMGAVNR
jgi:hypothetical protein